MEYLRTKSNIMPAFVVHIKQVYPEKYYFVYPTVLKLISKLNKSRKIIMK